MPQDNADDEEDAERKTNWMRKVKWNRKIRETKTREGRRIEGRKENEE